MRLVVDGFFGPHRTLALASGAKSSTRHVSDTAAGEGSDGDRSKSETIKSRIIRYSTGLTHSAHSLSSLNRSDITCRCSRSVQSNQVWRSQNGSCRWNKFDFRS